MSKAKLKHYKVMPEELLDLIDAAAIGQWQANLMRCPGGRLIADGYICPHCGEDPSMVYNSKGEQAEYPRKKGEKYHRKCGAGAKKTVATQDLTKLYPVHID